MCGHRVRNVFSVALEDFCCDCKSRHLSGFDWGSLQLLLCVIGIARRADLERRAKGGRAGKWGADGGRLAANMIICGLANFRRLDGPIPLVSIREQQRAEQSRAEPYRRKMNQV